MKCEEARDWFSSLLAGRIALTERALVEAHLRQCPECRQQEARLQRLAARRGLVNQLRATMAFLGKAMEVTRIAVAHVTALIARLSALPAMAYGLAARTVVGATRALGLGIARLVAGIMHLSAGLMIPLRLSVRAEAKALEALGLGITRSVNRIARRPAPPAIPFSPTVRAAGAVLALAFALYALQQSDGPDPYAHPAAPPDPELEPPPFESTRIVPLPRAPSGEQRDGSPARLDDPRPSASRASTVSSLRVPASESSRGVSLSSVPVRGSIVPAAHVVGRLSTKDRSAAERDFTALLADVGGTELGRRDRIRFTAVEVIVPQSRYSEFAHGLGRLGSWELEAARLPLPDTVHMTIRVSE